MSSETDQISPFSHIFISTERTLAISGSTFFVIDHGRRDLLSSATVTSSDKNASAFIRVAAVDKMASHLVTSGDDKRLRVWNLHTMEEMSNSYPLIPKETKPASTTEPSATSTSKSIAVAMHDNPEGTLILGHTSIVTAFMLTPDEKLVISADRDEHVRVSWYPDGWDVEKYCMGHKKFISALEIPACAPHTLISGGGDPDLYVWDYRAGKLLAQIPIWETVRPFLKVRGGRKKWKDSGEGKRSSKGKKRKGKQENEAEASEAMDTSADKSELAGAAFDEEVLAVSQISYSQFCSNHVVFFSVAGASAIFHFKWPTSLDFTGVSVKASELPSPVTEFNVFEGGDVWISVDPCWLVNPGAVQTSSPADLRRIIRLVWNDERMVENVQKEGPMKTLNESCIVKASVKDIQGLNLYDSLIALPKITELEGPEGGEAEESGTPVPSDVTAGPGLRASARQRTKEQLEKRKATTQESSQEQRSTKQPKVDEI